MRTYAVAVGIANVRRDPDPASELLTQALLNMSAVADRMCGEWTHVTLADYVGWMRGAELAEPPQKGFSKVDVELVAVVTAVRTDLYGEIADDDALGKVYLSTILPLLDASRPARIQVALPGGQTAWIARSAVVVRDPEQPYPPVPIGDITNYARLFLGVPYLWGGTSFEGIDCSGLVQLCYRIGGSIIPRDADQQHDVLSQSVTRAEMRAGDLLFFGSKAITHVGMALNHKEYIHASGQLYHRVLISSLDPADVHYYRRLDEILRAIKRVCP